MKISYIITIQNIIVDYTSKLSDARRIARRCNSACITKLVGQYYGEGYHAYYLKWDGTRFKRSKTNKE